MTESLHWAGAICGIGLDAREILPAGLFVAGVVGSLGHCVPMCGGFVLAQASERMARRPEQRLCEWGRVADGALLPYHLGRLATYGALGAAAGSAALLARAPWVAGLSKACLTMAAGLFLALAVRRFVPASADLIGWVDHAPRSWGRLVAVVAKRIPRGSALGGFALGLALGFLPCGFLYGALAASAASPGPAMGALGMVAFGLGTAPSLLAVGIGGQAAGRRWRREAAKAAPILMTINAALLLLLAWN